MTTATRHDPAMKKATVAEGVKSVECVWQRNAPLTLTYHTVCATISKVFACSKFDQPRHVRTIRSGVFVWREVQKISYPQEIEICREGDKLSHKTWGLLLHDSMG